MTPERQRIKIAELQGWNPQPIYREMQQSPTETELYIARYTKPPDYLNIRDALLLVLSGLTEDETYEFGEFLYVDILKMEHEEIDGKYPDITYRDLFLILTATPAQLCEAYLRAKGEWEE